MDINMPFKSGLEAKKEVSELFKNFEKCGFKLILLIFHLKIEH